MVNRLQALRTFIQVRIEEVMLIKNQADLDAFKKMYGINGEIEKEY